MSLDRLPLRKSNKVLTFEATSLCEEGGRGREEEGGRGAVGEAISHDP